MNIKSMALQNFKGVTDTIDIKQHNIFFGGNGSGKSGRVLAPMLAIMGHTHKGDTMETTAEFAGHEGCSVTLDFDDGFCFRRSLVRHHNYNKVSNSMKLDIKGQEKLGLRESERIVADHVGTFALMFDVKLFLGWSPEARRNYILGLSRGGEYEFNRLTLLARIAIEFCKIQFGEALVNDVVASSPDANTAYEKLCEKMPADIYSAYEHSSINISTELKDDLIKSIAGALGQAKQQMNASRQAWDAAEKTSETLSAQKSELRTISESVDELTTKLKQLTYCKEHAIEAHGRSMGVRHSVVTHKNSIEDIDNKIEAIVESLKNMTPCNPDEIKSKIDENQQQIEQLELVEAPPLVESLEPLSHQIESVKQLYEQATESESVCERNHDNEHHRCDRLVSDIEQLEDDDWKKVIDLITLIKPDIPNALIRTQQWTDLIGIIHGHNNCDELTAKQSERKESVLKVERLAAEYRTAKSITLEFKAARQACEREHRLAEERSSKQYDQYRTNQNEIARLEKENTKLKKTIGDHTSFVEKHHENEKNLREQRDGHELAIKKLEADFCRNTVEQIQDDIEDLKSKIEAVEKRIEDKRELAGLSKRIQECIEQAKAQQVMHEVYKKQVKAIQNVRENYMQELIAPLIENMDRFLWFATSNRRAYCDLVNANGKAIFELGWIIDDEYRVSLNALSGAESTVYCAALAYALVVLADPTLKLLILELGETDIITLNNMLDAIVEVCGDDIQSFVASHTTVSLVDLDWNVVSLPSRPDHVLVNRTMDTSKSNVTEDATNACVAT